MRYVSLFSGIEAATVAWGRLGWEPLAFCEVEPFPCAVLAYRFPEVPNLGDVREVDWIGFVQEHGAVDLVVGGSPCQSFSIAGGREGLRGESGLMFEYIRAVREIRPRYLLWENVPGALSVERGGAFRQLLSELDALGYGLAWRVLDAQFVRVPDRSSSGFFGPVAQRRRRVFLVGVLGSPHACEILFERESLRGHHPSGAKAREALAEHVGGCPASGDSAGAAAITQDGEDVSRTLTVRMNGSPCVGGRGPSVVAVSTANTNTNGANVNTDGASYTLDGANSNAVAFAQNTRDEVRLLGGDGQVCGALAASPGMKQQTYVCMESDMVRASVIENGVAPTLNASHTQPLLATKAVLYSPKVRGGSDTYAKPDGTAGKGALVSENLAFTVAATQNQTIVEPAEYVVRRLTPLECERLQGFPDGWTDIPYKGKEHPADTPRYKALGNSMAVPCMLWIGRRIAAFDVLHYDEVGVPGGCRR